MKGRNPVKNQTKRILALAAGALFLVLILLVRKVDVAAIGPEGTQIGLSGINRAVHEGIGVNFSLYSISQWIGYAALAAAACLAAAGLCQLIRRKSLMKVDRDILALGALYAVTAALYVFFEKFIVNYRPVIMPGETYPEASFPSSHTMLFCVILGSAGILAVRHMKNNAGKAAAALCWGLAIVGVALRTASGVHWCTDIVAGLLISAALLGWYSAALMPKKE